jgi:hypothetical protein
MATQSQNPAAGSQNARYRITPGSAFASYWKVAAGVGAVSLLAAGAGAATDPKRFAFSYLFAFFCFLTVGLGSLFFVLMQHLTGAHWSVSVRRIAEFYASGLVAFVPLVLPVIIFGSTLYPWMTAGHGGEHGAPAHEKGGKEEHHGSLGGLFEKTAIAAQHGQHAGDGTGKGPDEHHAAKGAQEGDHGGGKGLGDGSGKGGGDGSGSKSGHEAGTHPGNHGAMQAALDNAHHEEHARLLAWKGPYLNHVFWLTRAFFYVVLWSVVSLQYFLNSKRQDLSRSHANTVWAQKMAPLATLGFGVTLTFAGVDWLMSLDPMWYSTMWGVYLFAGSMVAAFAALILTVNALKKAGYLGDAVTVEHFHDLGKFQFGFLAFWAYVTFSQFFLIWYSNIPEELTFFHRRWTENDGSWRLMSVSLVVGHFLVPFWMLMSRNVKRRVQLLAAGAVLIFAMHVLEIYWIVLPNFGNGAFAFHWLDVACFLGVGGAYLAVVFRAMASESLVPIGDPRLVRALHHET